LTNHQSSINKIINPEHGTRNEPINQLTNQPINQSTNQPITNEL
jgi:hypothetical protein